MTAQKRFNDLCLTVHHVLTSIVGGKLERKET
jgi:hypothetical protein